jgi:hypothetical protein
MKGSDNWALEKLVSYINILPIGSTTGVEGKLPEVIPGDKFGKVKIG